MIINIKKSLYYSKSIAYLTSLIIIISTLSGCSQVKSPVTKTGLYFDTVISITLYEKNSSELIDECFKIAEKYENILSKTIADSDVSKINNSYNEYIKINEETFSIISEGLMYESLSDGHFSVMCGALTDLWDIGNKSSSPENVNKQALIPTDEEIKAAISCCGANTIELNKEMCAVKIVKKGARLDLGAVAKGFIADKMKEYLLSEGVTSGIIQLGGNVLLIGNNPIKDDGLYSIGIAKPFSNDGDVITAVSEYDNSIVTSGNYQRYFEYGGKIYHHIIDLKTGYPSGSGLNSVTIICANSMDADIMSTICFLLGEEKSKDLINSLNESSEQNIKAIYVTSDNELIK